MATPVCTLDTHLGLGGKSWGCTSFLPDSLITVSNLAPWIRDGKLVVKRRLDQQVVTPS